MKHEVVGRIMDSNEDGEVYLVTLAGQLALYSKKEDRYQLSLPDTQIRLEQETSAGDDQQLSYDEGYDQGFLDGYERGYQNGQEDGVDSVLQSSGRELGKDEDSIFHRLRTLSEKYHVVGLHWGRNEKKWICNAHNNGNPISGFKLKLGSEDPFVALDNIERALIEAQKK